MSRWQLYRLIFIFLCYFIVARSHIPLRDKIKHIVVLMEENRSFDHLLGFMRAKRVDINGCIPELGPMCSNPLNPYDAPSELVYVSNDAEFEQSWVPNIEWDAVTMQLFASDSEPKQQNNQSLLIPKASMNGFIKSLSIQDTSINGKGNFIMKCFDEDTAPIIHKLANEFAVIDTWFSDIAGPTFPNRVMAMRGYADDLLTKFHNWGLYYFDLNTKLIPGLTGFNIFEMIDKHSINDEYSWNVFHGDFPTAIILEYVRQHPSNIFFMNEFYKKVADGTLPFFSWIEPSYFDISWLHKASDQHAPHDIREGEKLIKKIYESLRKSPIWNETLFLIYWDEHGGFFDHVPPPICPNAENTKNDFMRLGLRVPAVLISPWIRKGTTSNNSINDGERQYCHSSLIHTIRNEYTLNAPPLSKREEWSLTFENLINLDVMRTDCPVKLPEVASASSQNIDSVPLDKNKRFNAFQLNAARIAGAMVDKFGEIENYISSEGKLGQFVLDCLNEWKNKQCNMNINAHHYILGIMNSAGCFEYGIIDKNVGIGILMFIIIILTINCKTWLQIYIKTLMRKK